MGKWLRQLFKENFFAGWLRQAAVKNTLLGYAPRELTLSEKLFEISKIRAYTRSDEYKAWEQEAWAQSAKLVTYLANPEADPKKIDFCRGALSQTFGLLRIGREMDEKARLLEAEASKQKPLGMTRHSLTPTART